MSKYIPYSLISETNIMFKPSPQPWLIFLPNLVNFWSGIFTRTIPALFCVCFCLKHLSLHCWWHITDLTINIIVTHARIEPKSYITLDVKMPCSCFEFAKQFIAHQHHAWTHVEHQNIIKKLTDEMKQNGTKQSMKWTLI